MKKHFVTFLSPGTFCAEQTTQPIEEWNVDEAVARARNIVERHAATPYGFQFSTRERTDDDLDSKVTETSGVYYLGGEIQTLEQIKAKGDPADSILISNMECNGWDRVVINTNSWRWTQPLNDGDIVLPVDFTPASPSDAGEE